MKYFKLCLLISLYLLVGNTSFAQERKGGIPEYQVDVNTGYPHFILVGGFDRAYNKSLIGTPFSISLNLQKNIRKKLGVTLGGYGTRAKEVQRFNSGNKYKEGAYLSGVTEFGLKFFTGIKVIYFVQPQVGLSIYRFPKLTGIYSPSNLSFERTESTSWGIAYSVRVGAEFKIMDKWYIQPTVSLNHINTIFGGDYTYSETDQSGSKVTTQWGSTNKYVLLNFMAGIGRYFGKR